MKVVTSQKKNRGFTLVELLVVIAIVATLAGLAVIGVRTGLRSAAATATSTNMKDIYASLSAISAEGVNTGLHAPGTLPPYKGNLQDGQEASFIWWDLVAEKMEIADRDSGKFRWVTPYSETKLQNPLSKAKIGAGKTTYDSLHNEPDESRGGFAYNAELGGDVSSDAQDENVYKVRLGSVEDPHNTIFFGEADDKQDSAGWVFKNIANAPQGNYKESAHCCMIGGNIKLIKNTHLKERSSYDYYTQFEDKNYSDNPE